MRWKKLLRNTGIALLVGVVLLLLAVAVFVYNPLEGSLTDMRYVVPRDVEFFVRKVDLADDFTEFPEPLFWQDLIQQPAWQQIQQGPTYQELNGHGEMDVMFADIRNAVTDLTRQTGGWLDPVRDLIGREVEIAGKLADPTLGGPSWCLYARVRWPVKFAHGLLGYSLVQDRIREQGLAITADDQMYRIEGGQLGQPIFITRHLDCLMIGNERDLVRRSWELASGYGSGDSFGGSSNYKDAIQGRLQEWLQATHQDAANALEFFVRPNELLNLPQVTFDDGWPDPNAPDDMNERVLASFVNLQGWLFLSGALAFEPGSATLLAAVELNQNEHTPFQARFFQTESQRRSEWLDPFVGMVPDDAAAFAAMRMPAGEFLREMFSALEPAERDLFNEGLAATGVYSDAFELIRQLEPAFFPRTGFIFRKNVPDPGIEVADPTAVPQVAWVFWLREGGRPLVENLVETVTTWRDQFGFTKAYNLPLGLSGQGEGGDAAREFVNPQIPGTGEIATLLYPPFFVISNSGPFIRDIIRTMLGQYGRSSIRTRPDYQLIESEVADAINGFVFVQGPQMEELLQDYENDALSSTKNIDPAWAMEHRSAAENAVFRRDYAREFRSLAAMPADVRTKFDEDVNRELESMWRRERSSYGDQAVASLRQTKALVQLFRAAYVQLRLEPRHLRMQGRALARFR